MLRLERHPLGLRLFVVGRRVHEWHLGAAAIAGFTIAAFAGAVRPVTGIVAALLGLWLVVKDWPDLTRTGRDTAGWRLGLHRRPLPLRPWRFLDDVPSVAALATAVVGLVDLVSAVTPNVSWRGRVLLHVEPVSMMRNAHALAVPASIALVLTAYYLYRRRARALVVAIALMLALTVFDLVKGLDFDGAALTLGCAVLLWMSRSSFSARHTPGTLRSALLRVPLLVVAAFAVSLAVIAVAAPVGVSTSAMVRETVDLLLWQPGPFGFRDELAKTGLAVELVSLLTLLTIAYVIFRPLAAPRDLPDAELRHAAADLVRRYGTDTLSFFKLRADKHYLFDATGNAFVGYRVESGVMVISGDPVGEWAAVAELVKNVVDFAEARSLRIAALGVSPSGKALFEQAGLRALYVGDEAIVDTEGFSVEGRAIRKVRQSVTRLEKAGYSTELAHLGALDESVLIDLEAIAATWRRGAPERGFSMAMDSLRNPHGAETLVLCARDGGGKLAGFLQFVPTYGRSAVSLSQMRRRHDTPNGLTEFMVVKAIEELRARGIAEASLNFAAFARLFRQPRGVLERLAGRLVALGDAWFQIERLYRFNAKFFPRWEPRYFMYEHRFGLPRAGIAALWLEGQLPRPASPSRRRALERVA
jgi:lysyl-tRNA synthetase, class II